MSGPMIRRGDDATIPSVALRLRAAAKNARKMIHPIASALTKIYGVSS